MLTQEMLKSPGSSLRILRESKKISQRKLAQMSGLHWNSIARIERWERIPRTETLLLLLEAIEKAP